METEIGAIADCLAAIQCKRVPLDLSIHDTVAICCVVRGIRYHEGFAQELHGKPELPEVTRTLNARAIMSNTVPMMPSPEDFPYCFWHPDVPREETLRQLLVQYPANTHLRYQVGRACAAGGYTARYDELNLLPEVAIAEEARDNTLSGQAIYDAITKAPIRYTYMNDYNCCLHPQPLPGAYLNGDTCVRSNLDMKQPMGPFKSSPLLPKLVFDITEDRCIDIDGLIPAARPIDPQVVTLLYTPLPADLPTYWLTQLNADTASCIHEAVYARCIMNNDLSWLTDSIPDQHLPHLIWFPQPASQATYTELVRRRPSMIQSVARACIRADYQDLFDSLDITPDVQIVIDARNSTKGNYMERIKSKAAELNIDIDELDPSEEEDWADILDYIQGENDGILRLF
ncbi:hypothetical protein BDW59DRAFT_181863 [Aspergillus cavernicola]|uniref:Uncharacterized protein n=1 Tax=Aspergillus cavernicola TaxID=176166 RepID=A0ABR4HUB7_9EURO